MTEREKVLLLREGARRAVGQYVNSWEVEVMVEKFFPMPTITRPRVATLGIYNYRVVDGKVQVRANVESSWREASWTVDELRLLGSLPDHPTEEVEDEDE